MPTSIGERRRRAQGRQLAFRRDPAIAFYEVPMAQAQDLLIAWRHPLHLPTEEHPQGQPYNRPCGRIRFLMEDAGRPAAVVVLASTINVNVSKEHGLHRYNCVDIARLGRSPDRRDKRCLRAVLRVAVEYLVPLWPRRYPRHWPRVDAVVSTSLPGTLSARSAGSAGLYRFDGFRRPRVTRGPSGGGTYGKPSAANTIDDGERGLWAYRCPTPLLAAPQRP
jgi:hypothetical protein